MDVEIRPCQVLAKLDLRAPIDRAHEEDVSGAKPQGDAVRGGRGPAGRGDDVAVVAVIAFQHGAAFPAPPWANAGEFLAVCAFVHLGARLYALASVTQISATATTNGRSFPPGNNAIRQDGA